MIRLRLVPGESPRSGLDVDTHPRAHLSDILAAYLLQHYGHNKYGEGAAVPGDRTVLVGRGGYDEHDPENIPDPRVPECEATLVAKDLGIQDLPELGPILDYTFKVDRYGQGKGVLKFGRVVELMHDVHPNEPQRVWRWASVLIETSIEAARARAAVLEPDAVVYPIIARAYRIVEREFTPEVRLASFRLDAAVQPFGLPFCAGLLWWKFRSLAQAERDSAVVAWVTDALRAELTSRQEFLAASSDYEKGDDFTLTISGEGIIGISVATDNRRIHSYLFNEIGWIAVAAVRRLSGNVQVFRKPRAKLRLELWSVAAQLRAKEQEKAGEPVSPWNDLVSQRGPEGAARRWFFYHPTQTVFNGSLTTAAEPTALTDEEILGCIVRGLDDQFLDFRRQFYLERGGPVG